MSCSSSPFIASVLVLLLENEVPGLHNSLFRDEMKEKFFQLISETEDDVKKVSAFIVNESGIFED